MSHRAPLRSKGRDSIYSQSVQKKRDKVSLCIREAIVHIVEGAGIQKQSVGKRKEGRGASSHEREEVKTCPREEKKKKKTATRGKKIPPGRRYISEVQIRPRRR